MKLSIRHLLLIKLCTAFASPIFTLALDATSLQENTGYNQPLPRVPYPSSVVDLIVDYFRNYKHIKRLTLFLCDDHSFGVTVPRTDDENERFLRTESDGNRQQTQAPMRHLNFQQIVERLMATGNFFIKGDANIDAKKFRVGDPFYVRDMMVCGDFKLGVVLDLRCRQSKFYLQQVTVAHVTICRLKLSHTHTHTHTHLIPVSQHPKCRILF